MSQSQLQCQPQLPYLSQIRHQLQNQGRYQVQSLHLKVAQIVCRAQFLIHNVNHRVIQFQILSLCLVRHQFQNQPQHLFQESSQVQSLHLKAVQIVYPYLSQILTVDQTQHRAQLQHQVQLLNL